MRRLSICIAGFSLLAGPAVAQNADWSALIVGSAQDAVPLENVAGGIEAAIGAQAQVLRDADAGALRAAVATTASDQGLIVYLSAPIEEANGVAQISLGGTGIELRAMLDLAMGSGTDRVLLLVENCTGADAGALPEAGDVPEGLTLSLLSSADPGGDCPMPDARLGARLAGLDVSSDFATMSGAFWRQGATLDGLFALSDPAFPVIPADQSPISIVNNDTVALAPVSAAATSAAPEVVTAAVPQQDAGPVVVFTPPPQAQLAALPLAAGLPEPSIIVGLIEDPAEFEELDITPASVSSSELAYDDLEGRLAMRSNDPELFASLVETGAFDPPQSQLAVALQTELARMNCYRAGIDGIWGGGSEASVRRYFDEVADEEPEGVAPTVGLFRQIIRREDVECPVVAAAPAPARPSVSSTPSRNTTTRSTPTRRAAPAPQPVRRAAPAPQRQPQPQPQQQRRIDPSRSLGVFR